MATVALVAQMRKSGSLAVPGLEQHHAPPQQMWQLQRQPPPRQLLQLLVQRRGPPTETDVAPQLLLVVLLVVGCAPLAVVAGWRPSLAVQLARRSPHLCPYPPRPRLPVPARTTPRSVLKTRAPTPRAVQFCVRSVFGCLLGGSGGQRRVCADGVEAVLLGFMCGFWSRQNDASVPNLLREEWRAKDSRTMVDNAYNAWTLAFGLRPRRSLLSKALQTIL